MDLISIETPDGPMTTASAHPVGDPTGAVIVVQEAFGLTDHIAGLTDRLAGAGYRSVAPALFHRVTEEAFGYDDLDSVMPLLQSLDAEQIRADLDATIELLKGEGFADAQIGMVGFCMGGSITFAAATRGGLGAAVSFYGGGVATGRFGQPSLIELAPSLAVPWLGLYGDLDQSIPVDQVDELRCAAAGASVPTEIVRYPDAGHGFNCNDRPAHFDQAAAADAWSRMLTFFGEHLRR
jgi:carboxymethylenebutenolidase